MGTRVELSNTKKAFAYKSTLELLKTYTLFAILRFPKLTYALTRLVSIALKLHLPIEWAIKFTVFQQFCGGESVKECSRTIHRLWQFRVGTILDYSVEGLGDEKQFDSTTQEILSTIDLAKSNESIPFCVFKPTGIAPFGILEKLHAGKPLTPDEEAKWSRATERFTKLCERAHQNHVKLFIDAEESWIQDPVDKLAEECMEKYNQKAPLIYTTVQMYRVDRRDYLEKLISSAEKKGFKAGIKLVRGAYLEKERKRAESLGQPSPLYPEKAGTDAAYNSALQLCLSHREAIGLCVATHNDISTARAIEEVDPSRDKAVYFAQLLGMSDNLSFNLSNSGYQVAKYTPYGPVRSMMPYLFRRAQENTAIAGQTLRELVTVRRELFRRLGLRKASA